MKFLNSQITSKMVEQKGQKMYMLSKWFMFIGLCSFALTFLIGIISVALDGAFFGPFIFALGRDYAFAYIFVAIDYIAKVLGLIGIGLYFKVISLFALGRIALNTEKE